MTKLLTRGSSAAAIASLSLVVAFDTSAEPVFRWKDKQGNPVFNDRAPIPNQPFVIIRRLPSFTRPDLSGTPLSGTPFSENPPKLTDLEFENWVPADPEAPRTDTQRESMQRTCDQARTTLKALAAEGRVFWRAEDGSRIWLDRNTRLTQGALAEEIIRLTC